MNSKDIRNFFTVIIPTYNMLKFVKKAVNSVLCQQYKNFEIIVVDNYSNDGTEDYFNKLKNKRIRYFKLKNNGVIGKSRNFGIKKSKGNWLAFLDADDIWMKNKLYDVDRQIHLRKFDVVCSSEMIIDNLNKKKKIWHYGPYTKNFYETLLRCGNRLSTSSTVVRKEFIRKKNILFSEKKSFANFEDYDFFLNISKKKGIYYFIKKIHGKHLFHQHSSTMKRKKLREAFFSVINHHVKLQKFTNNRYQLNREINFLYDLKTILTSIFYKKRVFYNSLKFILFFILNPIIMLNSLKKILENDKNVIRID